LHLYDVLTQLGYKVFLDQFVLPREGRWRAASGRRWVRAARRR
jgi:hypothetical protein